jgi:hypothetical protein
VSSSFRVLSRTTGVPKYKIAGSVRTWRFRREAVIRSRRAVSPFREMRPSRALDQVAHPTPERRSHGEGIAPRADAAVAVGTCDTGQWHWPSAVALAVSSADLARRTAKVHPATGTALVPYPLVVHVRDPVLGLQQRRLDVSRWAAPSMIGAKRSKRANRQHVCPGTSNPTEDP